MDVKKLNHKTKFIFYFLFSSFYFYLFYQFKFEVTPYLSNLNSSNPIVWLKIIFLIILNFFEKPILFYLWIVSFSKKVKIDDLNHLVKEYIRSIGSIFSWSLFLIIPGLIRFIQLYWVSTIVLLNPNYSSGQLDALAESSKTTMKNLKVTLLLIVLIDLLMPIFLDSLIRIDNLFIAMLNAGMISIFFYFHIYLFNKKLK